MTKAILVRVFVDFNGMHSETEIHLEFMGTRRDLSRYRVRLREEMALTVYDPGDGDSEMEMDGIAHYRPATDNRPGYWFAKFDPKSFRRVDIQRREAGALDFPCFHCGADIYGRLGSHGWDDTATCPDCGGLVNEATLAPNS
jgi:hypothetical protein